jgi:phage shock protein A
MPELIVTLIIGIFGGGGLINFFHLRSNNKKIDADAASTLVGAAGELVQMYKCQLEELEDEVAEMRAHISAVEKERDRLKARVDQLEQKVERLEWRSSS